MPSRSGAESLPELKKPTRFKPRRAVRHLLKTKRKREIHALFKKLALAQLFAWAILDQRAGKRLPKVQGGEPGNRHKRPVRTLHAERFGRIVLANLFDRANSRDSTKLILTLIRSRGGLSRLTEGRSSNAVLSRAKKAAKEIEYVYKIMDFLCRYKESGLDDSKSNIQCAKYFVEKTHLEGPAYKQSKIEKIWLKYKASAPYIFAFYETLVRRLAQSRNVADAIDIIEQLAADHQQLTRLLGTAAYAADVLVQRVHKSRDVRISDFKKVERVAPSSQPFNSDELAIINRFDPNAPIA